MQSNHAWVLLVAGLGILHAVSPAPAVTAADDIRSFRAFLQDFERGTTRFINGDPGPWKANVSQRDDVTLMGGWGIVAHGWKDTTARYDWAARRFVESDAVLQVDTSRRSSAATSPTRWRSSGAPFGWPTRRQRRR